jgi:hypothetical protein
MMTGVTAATLLPTLIGALLALGGTLLAYLLNARERRTRESRADRRKTYLDFIAAVEQAHAGLRRLADPLRNPEGDLVIQTREVFSEAGIYGARERVIVTADPKVIAAAERTLQTLNDLRRAVRDGAQLNTLPFHHAYHHYAEAVWDLRRIARADFGASKITPADVGKVSWDSEAACAFCQRALAEGAHEAPSTGTGDAVSYLATT